MEWIDSTLDFLKQHDALLWWLFAASVTMFMLTPLVAGWLVVWMPEDYFVAKERPSAWGERHPVLRPVILVVKNLFGFTLLIAGLAMVVLPGQGLLTMIAGLLLIDFPGKFRAIRRLVRRRQVWRSLNWLRRRAGRPPLKRPR